MVLYCAQHSASIIRAIIHKFKYHPNDDTVIFGEYPVNTPYYPKIDGVIYYQMPNVYQMVTYSQDSAELINNIQNTIDDFMKKMKLSFSDFACIYSIYDLYNPFTVYFELNKIAYMCIEMNPNFFNFHWEGKYIGTRPENERCYYETAHKLHSQDGQGKYCRKGFLFSAESKVPQGDVPVEVFDYYKSLLTLDERQKKQLIDAYQLNKYRFNCLVLFNSFGWTRDILIQHKISITAPDKYDTKENVYLFYKVVIDYYFKDVNFALKLHPSSDNAFIKAFSAFEQLPSQVYVELFALLDNRFQILCPLQSTGVDVFKKIGYKITCFSWRLIPFFRYIHFVNLAFLYLNKWAKSDNIYIYGIDIEQLRYFVAWCVPSYAQVEYIQLTEENAHEAKYIMAAVNDKLSNIVSAAPEDCIIICMGDFISSKFKQQKMKCDVIDMAYSDDRAIQSFVWSILSNKQEYIETAKVFCPVYELKNAQIRIQATSV